MGNDGVDGGRDTFTSGIIAAVARRRCGMTARARTAPLAAGKWTLLTGQ